MNELAPLLWIVAIALIFWLLIIRPAQRRQKEVAQVQAAIAPGEQVMLTSGIFGTVRQADEATLLVEVSPGVTIKVARGAVGSVVREEDETDQAPVDPTETGADGDGEDR